MSLTYTETNQPIAIDTEDDAVVYIDRKIENGIRILETNGKLKLVPQIGIEAGVRVSNLYVVGASGDGKTTFCRDYALTYKELYPKHNIFLFTCSDERNIPENDRVFYRRVNRYAKSTYAEFLELKHHVITNKILTQSFDINNFKNSLIIFDDFLYCRGENAKETKEIKFKLCSVIVECLNIGRKLGISVIVTSHLLYERGNNDFFQNLYGEIHVLAFGRKTNRGQLRYVFEKYFSIPKRIHMKILNFDKCAFMTILNRYPPCLLSEHKMELLDDF